MTATLLAGTPPALRFDVDAAQAAADAWGFNCGPGALCAVLARTPEQIRSYLPAFPGYTSVPFMRDTLNRMGVRFSPMPLPPRYAAVEVVRPTLMRMQWTGPWMAPGVPARVHAGYTHWVALWPSDGVLPWVYDVNGTCAGWLSYVEWATQLVPWLMSEMKRKPDGWYPTHLWALNLGGLA